MNCSIFLFIYFTNLHGIKSKTFLHNFTFFLFIHVELVHQSIDWALMILSFVFLW